MAAMATKAFKVLCLARVLVCAIPLPPFPNQGSPCIRVTRTSCPEKSKFKISVVVIVGGNKPQLLFWAIVRP